MNKNNVEVDLEKEKEKIERKWEKMEKERKKKLIEEENPLITHLPYPHGLTRKYNFPNF